MQNILFVHSNNYDIGGSDYCLFKLVTTIDRNKFNPFLLLGLDTKIANRYRAAGIPVIIKPMLRLRKTKNPIYHARYLLQFMPTVRSIMELIKKYDIDLIHSNDFQDLYGGAAAQQAGIKSIQHIRLIMEGQTILRKSISSFILQSNNRIAVVSDAVGRKMFARKGRVPPKVVTCYDWLDMERVGHARNEESFRAQIGVKENQPLIGAIGRLEPWKGQHVFVKAAALVSKDCPEARFVIVGGKVSGRGRELYEQELKRLASELNIENQLVFRGHRMDIANVMSSLNVYVHCSTDPDPLPGVVMEAMACARPVIGPRAGGVPEEIEENITGYLYEPGNEKAMAGFIKKLIANPQRAEQLGMAGKRRAERIFNKNTLCRQMEELYKEILYAN